MTAKPMRKAIKRWAARVTARKVAMSRGTSEGRGDIVAHDSIGDLQQISTITGLEKCGAQAWVGLGSVELGSSAGAERSVSGRLPDAGQEMHVA